MTYLVAGARAQATLPALRALAAGGADVIELGVPFSDPEAESRYSGGVRASALPCGDASRRTRHGQGFRQENSETLVLMGYLNSVERMGYESFAVAAAEAGIDGLILVNLPPGRPMPCRAALPHAALTSFFCSRPPPRRPGPGPSSSAPRALSITFPKGPRERGTLIRKTWRRALPLRTMTGLPIAIGFGIRDGATAQRMAPLGDGVVVGSAIVRRMGSLALEDQPAELEGFARSLREALDASC